MKRLVLLVPLLLGVTLLTFSLTKTLPGDPVYGLVGERAKPEVIEKIRRELGTRDNVIIQYLGYLKLLLQGEFGRSYYTNREVFGDIPAAAFDGTSIRGAHLSSGSVTELRASDWAPRAWPAGI